MIDKAREATHATLRQWSDEGLDETYPLGEETFSRGWTVYHIVEHFIGHAGQILLLKHMLKKG